MLNKNKFDYVSDVMVADLYNNLYKSCFGMTEYEYRKYKEIGNDQVLQDHMNRLELEFNNFLEGITPIINDAQNAKGWEELKLSSIQVGEFVKDVIKMFEERFHIKVISKKNNMNDYFKRNADETLNAILEMDKDELEALVDVVREKKKGKK